MFGSWRSHYSFFSLLLDFFSAQLVCDVLLFTLLHLYLHLFSIQIIKPFFSLSCVLLTLVVFAIYGNSAAQWAQSCQRIYILMSIRKCIYGFLIMRSFGCCCFLPKIQQNLWRSTICIDAQELMLNNVPRTKSRLKRDVNTCQLCIIQGFPSHYSDELIYIFFRMTNLERPLRKHFIRFNSVWTSIIVSSDTQ